MKLDKKVKANAIIGHCFNAEEMTKYIGQECYFADDIATLGILSNSIKRVLVNVDNDREYPYETKSNDDDCSLYYSFCLPAEFVVEEKTKEKQYRPYTLMEFTDKFTVGCPIKFRKKGEVGFERYFILNGYWNVLKNSQTNNGQPTTFIYIGSCPYTLNELFNEYEWQGHYTEDFKPFGVEEK